jgi:cleavage and polyadenylation specificity factor subunit 2
VFHHSIRLGYYWNILFQIPGHEQVYINDPRLSDFKQILQKNGVQAEFAGGVLVCCNGVLAITRVSKQ